VAILTALYTAAVNNFDWGSSDPGAKAFYERKSFAILYNFPSHNFLGSSGQIKNTSLLFAINEYNVRAVIKTIC